MSPRRDALVKRKESLKLQQQEASVALTEQHRRFLELQIRRFRRRKLLQFHLLEQDLLREVAKFVLIACNKKYFHVLPCLFKLLQSNCFNLSIESVFDLI